MQEKGSFQRVKEPSDHADKQIADEIGCTIEDVKNVRKMFCRYYSVEDVRRPKLIKMLRMPDMPLKEIEQVLNGGLLLKETVTKQQEKLLVQQRQLQAAV